MKKRQLFGMAMGLLESMARGLIAASATVLLFAGAAFPQGWVPQNSGTNRNLSSVHFVDELTGWACGDTGTMVKTTDGGAMWSPLTTGTLKSLRSVRFANSNVGYTVGDSGTILKSTDGGNAWTPQSSGTVMPLTSVHFNDASTGWAVGGNGIILKTVNGGITWLPQSGGTTAILYSVYFVDANRGWIGGAYNITGFTFTVIITTTNGGASWIADSIGIGVSFRNLHFTNANTGWFAAIGGGTSAPGIYKTVDGGMNWSLQFTGGISSVYSLNADTVYAGGGGANRILKTTDGGISWASQSIITTLCCSSMHFPSDSIGYGVGGRGTIFKTSSTTPIFPPLVGSRELFQVRGWDVSVLTSGNHFLDLRDLSGKTMARRHGKGQATYTLGNDVKVPGIYLLFFSTLDGRLVRKLVR